MTLPIHRSIRGKMASSAKADSPLLDASHSKAGLTFDASKVVLKGAFLVFSLMAFSAYMAFQLDRSAMLTRYSATMAMSTSRWLEAQPFASLEVQQEYPQSDTVPSHNHTLTDNKAGDCTLYSLLEDLYNMPNPEHPPAKCAQVVINPGRPIVLLKVATSVSLLRYYQRGVDSFVQFATAPEHNHTLLVYLVGNDTLRTLDAPHFGKIVGLQHALQVQKPTVEWVTFTDLDFLVRKDDSANNSIPTLADVVAEAPRNTSLILQKEKAGGLCSAFHLWKPSEWTHDFLNAWLSYGRSKCCMTWKRNIFYDQLAWTALLADHKKAGLPFKGRLRARFDQMIEDQEALQNNYHMTELNLHAAYWNTRSPKESLFWHTGHQLWWRHGYWNTTSSATEIPIGEKGNLILSFY